MSGKILGLLIVAIFLSTTVHSYTYHSYENANANDDKNEADLIIFKTNVEFGSRSATKSRERLITYVKDGINNLFDEVFTEYIILNRTAKDITNSRYPLMLRFFDFADIKNNSHEVSSTSDKFEIIKRWPERLAAVARNSPTIESGEFLRLLHHIFMTQIEIFIENFMPLATDWYSYTKSLFDEANGFNTWYRMYSEKDCKTQFANFYEILKL